MAPDGVNMGYSGLQHHFPRCFPFRWQVSISFRYCWLWVGIPFILESLSQILMILKHYELPMALGPWQAIKTLRAGSTDGFRALAWSPDCSRLVAGGLSRAPLVTLVYFGYWGSTKSTKDQPTIHWNSGIFNQPEAESNQVNQVNRSEKQIGSLWISGICGLKVRYLPKVRHKSLVMGYPLVDFGLIHRIFEVSWFTASGRF